jgi:type I restriction enzyme R subunit
MNEAETRAELIDPALKAAGWGVAEASRIRREVIAPGRLEGHGRRAKPEIADYVLFYRNTKLAVIEAKARDKADTEGLGQAKRYAEKLQARFAFSTNGVGVYRVDMETGGEGHVSAWPSPQELWAATFPAQNAWRDRFAAVPFQEKGGDWALRYYQFNAVNKALERVQDGGRRILLTLATGTGKTTIAFQFAWKLFEAKWNLSGEPERRPRILFLADRNTLANQAYNDFNSFAAFEERALVRIRPDEIAKNGKPPKNGAVFFTIFQTFMSGRDGNGEPAPYFGEYPKDFFDCIIIDECHRGGAKDESQWRRILEYFEPALQLGLTATPRRTINIDTYAYFGEPVSLLQNC